MYLTVFISLRHMSTILGEFFEDEDHIIIGIKKSSQYFKADTIIRYLTAVMHFYRYKFHICNCTKILQQRELKGKR